MAKRSRVDASDWIEKLRKASAAVRNEGATLAVDAGALVLQEAAKERAPFRTGTLRRSIHVANTDQGTLKQRQVGPLASVPYAAIKEYGGVIKPKQARMLAWKTESGAWAFARRVVIPAKPYMRPAFDENKKRVQDAMVDAFRMVLAKVGP